jgi:hypothetical protein
MAQAAAEFVWLSILMQKFQYSTFRLDCGWQSRSAVID